MAGCPPVQNSVSAFENCFAPPLGLMTYGQLEAVSNIPAAQIAGWIQTAISQSKPPNVNASYNNECESMLRARGLLYCHTTPGDCGSAPPPGSAIATPQVVGLGAAAGSGVISGLGAAGILAGPATLGITAAIAVGASAIESLISHHSQAVANEQSVLCAVMNFYNPLIKSIDAQVMSGAISSDDGLTLLKQTGLTAINGLNGILQTCNAACYYRGYIQAQNYFAANYYPAISPASNIGPQGPGNPPDGWGTLPGGVTVTGLTPPPAPPVRSTAASVYSPAGPSSTIAGATIAPTIQSNNQLPGNPNASDNLNTGYNQQTGQSAQAADVPAVPINWTTVGLVAAAIILVVFLAKG